MKSCECGHGKAIHHGRHPTSPRAITVCNFPGCKCTVYTPMRTEQPL
jgi:hypothetical protein